MKKLGLLLFVGLLAFSANAQEVVEVPKEAVKALTEKSKRIISRYADFTYSRFTR